MSLKRILMFNQMKDRHDYSKMKEHNIDKLLKKEYKDSSKYLRTVCMFDLVNYSKEKNESVSYKS